MRRKPGYNPPGHSFRQTLSRVVEAPSSYKRPSEQEEGGSLTCQGDRICGARLHRTSVLEMQLEIPSFS